MSKTEIPRYDAMFAGFFGHVTRGLKHVPSLDRLIVGPQHKNVPDGWQHVRGTHASFFAPWVQFGGDPEGPLLPIPSLYKRFGIIAMLKAEIESLREYNPGSRDAVALRFGEAMVVGALAEGDNFRLSPIINPNLVGVAAGIGRGELCAKTGVLTPDNHFIAAQSAFKFQDNLPASLVPRFETATV